MKRVPVTYRGRNVLVGLQARDLLQLLRKGCTRLELASAGHYAVALNTPAIVSRLRRQGFAIVTVWERGKDRYGRRVRWVRYRLRGALALPVAPLRRAA